MLAIDVILNEVKGLVVMFLIADINNLVLKFE